jgi:hypothetical protein
VNSGPRLRNLERRFAMSLKTASFGDAALVLSASGVGAMALAGAYLAATAHGCRFHTVTASSAGAIVGALVAAGYNGRQLVRTMHALARAEFFGPERDADVAIANSPAREDAPPTSQLSSEPIQHWVNDRLRETLGVASETVTFSDLPRALVLSAFDLRGGRPRVWSSFTGPDMPVALAVRCACASPLRFAPVEWKDALLADIALAGGFSFDDLDDETLEHVCRLPALSFRSGHPGRERSSQRGPVVQDIEIPSVAFPPRIAAVPPIRDLLRTGYDAAAAFFGAEKSRISVSGFRSRRLEAASHPTLVEETMVELYAARRSILIAGGDLSWAVQLFPALALKALEGVSIRILHTKTIAPELSATLGRLGCAVRRTTTDPGSYGALIDADGPDGSAVLMRLQKGRLRGGTLLDHRTGELRAIAQHLESLWRHDAPQVAAPAFEPVDWLSVERALRDHVAPYRDAAIADASVEVEEVVPLAGPLNVAKLRRAEAVTRLYQRCDLPLYAPMHLQGGAWFLPPPVVEAVQGRLVAIAGLHRLRHCWSAGIGAVRVILVRNASGPPPAATAPGWAHLCPLLCELAGERYRQFDGARWRDLDAAWKALAHQSNPSRPASQALR